MANADLLLPVDFSPSLPLAVGFSGGADSSALLLAAHARWPGQVRAWHVNHGLQAAAPAFEAHCVALCQRHGIDLAVARVHVPKTPGESPENLARQARGLAFQHLAGLGAPATPVFIENSLSVSVFTHLFAIKEEVIPGPMTQLALAHHADDQAETVLLALSRGAGLGGLSAMPAQAQRGLLTLHRPLLGVRAVHIRAWLAEHGHAWVEDPSNQSDAFTRNRIRHHALPALEQALPGFTQLAARSAKHAAQAQVLLNELAQIDLQQVGSPPQIKALQALSPHRQANVLRHWLAAQHNTQASTAQLAQLQAQIENCRTRGHGIHIKLGSGFVLRSDAVLAFQATASRPRQGD